MTEELIRALEEEKKKNEVMRAEFKGMLQGLRASKLNPTDDAFLQVIDWMINGFMNIRDDMISTRQEQLKMAHAIGSLEARVKQLEETLKKFEEWK